MIAYRYSKEWLDIPLLQFPKHAMILPKKSLKKVLPERNPDTVPICERYTLSIPEAVSTSVLVRLD